MSYDYSVWEFEQKFNAGGGATPQQLVKERGHWRFVADPTAVDWLFGDKPNVGKVSIYMDYDAVYGPGNGGWTFVMDMVAGQIAGEEAIEGQRFGQAISLLEDFDNGGVYGVVVSSTSKTYIFRTYTDIEYSGVEGRNNWINAGFADVQVLKINNADFTESVYIDQKNCIVHNGTKITIPPFYAISPPEGHSNDISVAPLTSNTDVKTRCDIVWDGDMAWAFTNTNTYSGVSKLTVSAIDTWHYDNISGFDTLEKLTYHHYFDNNDHTDVVRKKIEGYVQVGTALQYEISATRYYEKFYVAVGLDKIFVFDNTGKSCGVIQMPEITTSVTQKCDGPIENKEQQTMYSNLCASNNNLFFASQQKSSSEQNRLWKYDLTAKTWSYTLIPGRAQSEMRHIVDGLDGYIWITNKNNHAVVKANAITGVIASSVRINRHPYRLMTTQSKEVYVASDPGSHKVLRKYYDPEIQGGTTGNSKGGFTANSTSMWKPVETVDVTDGQISVIDQSNDSQDAICAARVDSDKLSLGQHGKFFDDGQGYLWFIAPDGIGRLHKADKEIKLWFKMTENTPDGKDAPDAEMIPDNSTIDYSFYPHDTLPASELIIADKDAALTTAKNVVSANLTDTPQSDLAALQAAQVDYDIAIGRACIASTVTPIHQYQKWNGVALEDTTVKPYLVWTADGYSFNIVRLSALVRKPKYKHRATAMVATGDQAFIGD